LRRRGRFERAALSDWYHAKPYRCAAAWPAGIPSERLESCAVLSAPDDDAEYRAEAIAAACRSTRGERRRAAGLICAKAVRRAERLVKEYMASPASGEE